MGKAFRKAFRWVRTRFSWKFSGQCNIDMCLFSCALDWIVLIQVWFERSLHCAQVRGQKLMTSQVVGAMWISTGGYGWLLVAWVKGKKKRYFVWRFWDHMDRVRTCQNGHTTPLHITLIIKPLSILVKNFFYRLGIFTTNGVKLGTIISDVWIK